MAAEAPGGQIFFFLKIKAGALLCHLRRGSMRSVTSGVLHNLCKLSWLKETTNIMKLLAAQINQTIVKGCLLLAAMDSLDSV
jgi:hypothetical protein